jgi:hypothetical protein
LFDKKYRSSVSAANRFMDIISPHFNDEPSTAVTLTGRKYRYPAGGPFRAPQTAAFFLNLIHLG